MLLIFGCYSNSKFRIRNYNVSLRHYWMATTGNLTQDTRDVPPEANQNGETLPKEPIVPNEETIVPNEETIVPNEETIVHKGETIVPEGEKDVGTENMKSVESENSVTQEATNGASKDTSHEETQGARQTPESSENTKDQDDTKQTDIQMDLDTNQTIGVTKPLETSREGDESMQTTETETGSGAKDVSNEVTEKPDDTKNNSDSNDEWKTVEKSRKSPKRTARTEDKGAEMSPVAKKGLRMTKERKQSEWEKFVSSLSKELQQMMGGFWATEDTERYFFIIMLSICVYVSRWHRTGHILMAHNS